MVKNTKILFLTQQHVTERYTIPIFTAMHHWSTTNFRAPEDCFLIEHDAMQTGSKYQGCRGIFFMYSILLHCSNSVT